MYKIGYIDEDPGFRNQFRQFLKDDFEIVLFEISEDTTLETLTDDVFASKLDMLVIDFRLDETGLVDFNADSLVEKIQENNLYFPLIILTSFESDALDHVNNANLVNGKDMLSGDAAKVELFKKKISRIAHDYKTKLDEYLNELEKLTKKKETDILEPNEEDRFVELNNFIDKTVAAKGHLSRTFYSQDTNTRLDTILEKTEEILKKIENSKNV